jgi:hypothetical protein
MARYIDAEKLEEGTFPKVTNWYQEGWNDALKGAMLGAPTADVAPRAEVARGIFEEIEKVLNQEYTEIEERMKRTKDPDAQDGMEGELCGLDYALYLVSEIRKKYTDATDIGDGHKEGE